ncbi:Tol-Pal system protein TolB, partial [Erwinia amylovora]|nr:Tol-Pal system protein TolB [Erwinia amylovora]
NNLPVTGAIDQIQTDAWQAAGIPYVVVGNIKPSANNSSEVHYQLYDVQKKQFLLNELLTVPNSRVRQAAHMISDAIYQALTGIQGDFSGR